ncbi:Uncharacterized protein Rs2_38949 [Raphanus sativus]|nr:Uncharacterized protein Rs2_38949 [Raphanus sativus]
MESNGKRIKAYARSIIHVDDNQINPSVVRDTIRSRKFVISIISKVGSSCCKRDEEDINFLASLIVINFLANLVLRLLWFYSGVYKCLVCRSWCPICFLFFAVRSSTKVSEFVATGRFHGYAICLVAPMYRWKKVAWFSRRFMCYTSPVLVESLTITFSLGERFCGKCSLHQTVVYMFLLRSVDAAYGKIKAMFSTLGDPKVAQSEIPFEFLTFDLWFLLLYNVGEQP